MTDSREYLFDGGPAVPPSVQRHGLEMGVDFLARS